MENSEASVSSTATRTWHDFLERMRQPSATEFVKQIKNFIVSLSNNAPDPERDTASVQEFFSNMEASFRAHPLWAGRTEEELDSTGEGLEKYIMTKLFTRMFATHPDDIKTDNEFNRKSALIQQFIHPDHLEIQPIYRNETSWLQAQEELLKINTYKSPRDKLACILSCCKVISNSMFNASVSSNENPPGADDFFPVLIYVTIKANPPQFQSNLMYIQRYRNKSRLVGEAAYVFTNMLSAESFILNIDAKALSMNETEFVKNMESAQIVVSGLSGDYNGEHLQSQSGQSGQSQSVSESKLKEVPSVSDLENKGASMLVMDEEVSEKFENFRYLYSKAGDLTVGEVEDLLNGYKQLVFKYACLAKGMGVPVVQPEAPGIQTSGETRDDGKKEGLGVAEPPPETVLGGEMVDAPENDVQVEAVKVEGDRNDGVGASTHESPVTGEVASQTEENVEK
ncbi:putative VPS9 domain, RABX5, catalytic core helical domain-containing protein [Helianthus annuus]|nr:putative VPS9 domain, RABX5, catalytic core helical domain-containing protein [Helianthus annuus]KAJ0833604.1 putative VPS9 domain, RABX5, catalytic core helical domain-containing protein [Helianthus annuus]